MNKENQLIIKAIDRFGRVPEQCELLELLENDEICITQMNRKMLDLYEFILQIKDYIKENCIDDEFVTNLSHKEKNIIKVVEMIENKKF